MLERQEKLPENSPFSVYDGKRGITTYANLRDAFLYAVEDTSQFYNFTIPTEVGIQGKLYGLNGEEMIELTMNGRTGTVPRGRSRQGITVSTNYDFEHWFDLCLPVFDWENPLFDRGIFWLAINDSSHARLKFGLNRDHGAELSELLERTKEGESKVVRILHNALNGRFGECGI